MVEFFRKCDDLLVARPLKTAVIDFLIRGGTDLYISVYTCPTLNSKRRNRDCFERERRSRLILCRDARIWVSKSSHARSVQYRARLLRGGLIGRPRSNRARYCTGVPMSRGLI